jgi:hypothetical protein
MNPLHSLLLILHLLAMATLLGGFTSQISCHQRRITSGQCHGALLALVTGLALVAVAEMGFDQASQINHAKVAVKLGIGTALVALAWMGRSKTEWNQGWWSAGVLSICNTVIAVAW